jgi:protein required for attachment to host cells
MNPGQLQTWVLVADSARARAVRWTGRLGPLDAVEDFDFSYQHQPGRDIMSERPGRTHESHGTTRHAIEPHSDPVRQAEHRFADHVAEQLSARFARKDFDRLVLVAGPTMLGDLRAALPDAIRKTVHGELAKDLTHLTNHQLKEHLLAADII